MGDTQHVGASGRAMHCAGRGDSTVRAVPTGITSYMSRSRSPVLRYDVRSLYSSHEQRRCTVAPGDRSDDASQRGVE